MPCPIDQSFAARAPSLAMICERLGKRGEESLLWTNGREVNAKTVLADAWRQAGTLRAAGVGQGSVCAFAGEFGPETTANFIALAALGAIATPFANVSRAEQDRLAAEAGVEFWIEPEGGSIRKVALSPAMPHPLIAELAGKGHPGLIVFTSGSTGKPKAILHDVERVASKFVRPRPGWRSVMFLLMDHFGGFNTLLSVLANNGTGICIQERTPKAVCEAIVRARAELLPTTPTFLAMLIASGLWRECDLSSIRLVTYGAEPMPATTLARMRELLPNAEFKQTYGLSELGVLRSASPDPASVWLKVGGDGFETRIVEGQLHVRSESNMLGYLNAPSPIDPEGWMNTGDLVEERDGLIRFLGRRSEVINVGGQKVLPTEIEDVLLEAEGVADAVAMAIAHPLLGQAVVARVALAQDEEHKSVTERLRAHCRARLQKYKVPMRFEIVSSDTIATARAKKYRGN